MILKNERPMRTVSSIGAAMVALGVGVTAHGEEPESVAGIAVRSLEAAPASQTAEARSDCIADWGGDGIVNIMDFLAFINQWNQGRPETDLRADGEINILDVVAFLIEFNRGC